MPSAPAVFLSYASQDAEAARRLAEALREGGVEVWLDQNELVGGDAWDAKIRGQIAACALFVPLISAATQARLEGYFRLEWKLAAQRTHAMADEKTFILPVVIDDTRDAEARVPAEFKAVQWTRLPGGENAEKFCARVAKLLGATLAAAPAPLSEGPGSAPVPGAAAGVPPAASARRVPPWRLLLAGLMLGGVALVAALVFWLRKQSVSSASPPVSHSVVPPTTPTAEPVAENDKSLAVLPLENLSPDPDNAFFTEGMHSEIIATLGRIPGIKVISRNSALFYKGSNLPLADIAEKLGVANLVTGSVRRAGERLRITLELRRARDETLLWSQTYDRDLKDVFAVQSEIAAEVARLLQARSEGGLYGGAQVLAKTPAVYDLYLKALDRYLNASGNATPADDTAAFFDCVSWMEEALRLDPAYMPAAKLLGRIYVNAAQRSRDSRERISLAQKARHYSEMASRLAPGGAGDASLAFYWSAIERDHERGLQLAENAIRALPNDLDGYNFAGTSLRSLARETESLPAFKRCLELDPRSWSNWRNLLTTYANLRRAEEFFATLTQMEQANAPRRTLVAGKDLGFRLTGELIAADFSATLPPLAASAWAIRARDWKEALRLLDRALADSGLGDIDTLAVQCRRAEVLLRLGQPDEAKKAAASALDLAQTLSGVPEVGPSEKAGWQAMAFAAAERWDEALVAARQHVEAADARKRPTLRWTREILLAEILAAAGRRDEALNLLTQIIRRPWALTVPMLRVDPVWDPLRADPRFQALLDDPANSAPL